MAEDVAEVLQLRRQVAGLRRRVDELAGQVRAMLRRHEAGGLPSRELVRRPEAAAMVGVSVATLAAWARAGSGPPYRIIGNHALYAVAELRAWQAQAGTAVRPQSRHEADAPGLPGL